jgi:hypothetical protein
MFLQELAESFAEDTHATAVYDADSRHSSEKCAIDEFFYFARRFVDGTAYDIDFGGRGEVAGFILQFDSDAA